MRKSLWEILIPTKRNDGRPFRTRFHRVWDARVKEISGGMTILRPTKGKWISPEGHEFEERMIPVRVIADRAEINAIIDFTIKYYDQQAILAYKISNEVILRHRPCPISK